MAWTDLSYLDINLAGQQIVSAMYIDGTIWLKTDDMDITVTCAEDHEIYGSEFSGSLNVLVKHRKKEEIII